MEVNIHYGMNTPIVRVLTNQFIVIDNVTLTNSIRLHLFCTQLNQVKLLYQTSAGIELALRCVAFDTYPVAIDSDRVAFHTRFNVTKYITLW